MLNIKTLREKNNISQVELAKMIGVGQSTVAMWESRGVSPRMDKIPELAKIFNCSINELFAESEVE